MHNCLQSLLDDIKTSRGNSAHSSNGELQKRKLKRTEFLFEMFEYDETVTSSIKNHTPSVNKRVQGPVILDFQSVGSAVNMLKTVWSPENGKSKFIVLDRLVIDKDLVEFLQKEASLGALLLNNCQMATKCDLDLSTNSSIKELYILANESFLGTTITPPGQAEKLAVHLIPWGWGEYFIDARQCGILKCL
jgi:hypothetical protein